MESMINLVLTMIDTFNEYGDVLNFTKSDIDKIIKKHNFIEKILKREDNVECNELGWIILWKNKYVTDEQFCKHMNVDYIDGEFYIIVNSFDEVLPDRYDTEISALDYDDKWWDVGGYDYDNNINDYWDDYTEETLKEIMDFCFKKGIEIEGELMDENNTVLKNGKVYFNDQELVDLIDEDDLDELKTVLNNEICNAQESADKDHVYNLIKKAFVDAIGPFERKMVEKINKETEKIEKVEKIYIRLDFKMKDAEDFLRDQYNKYDYIDERYGDLIYVLKEMEFFDIKQPDYRYNGSGWIDNSYLNEMTRERLGWD